MERTLVKKNIINNILIYGCGNIGSRHVQGAIQVNKKTNIYIYDISKKSIKLCKQRLSLVKKNKKVNLISFIDDFKRINKFHLIILSTTSKKRYEIIKKLIKKIQFKYIVIEKIPFQNLKEFKKTVNLLKKYKIKAWVNCPNRCFKSYRNLKENLLSRDIISMKVDGGNWGFASNFIHYLDLFSFLSESLSIKKIDHNFSKLYKSKRKNFIEFDGYILLKSKNNDLLFVNENKKSNSPITIEISTINFKIIIFENLSKAILFRKQNNWKEEIIDFDIEKQSYLTRYIIEDILNKYECQLIKLENSYILNELMLNIFLNHYKNYNKKALFIPIT